MNFDRWRSTAHPSITDAYLNGLFEGDKEPSQQVVRLESWRSPEQPNDNAISRKQRRFSRFLDR